MKLAILLLTVQVLVLSMGSTKPKATLDESKGAAPEDGSKDATDYYSPLPYDPCWPPPYRCPRVCRGACCGKWGCTARPYAAEKSQGYHGPRCGPAPYRCPSPCHDPCCRDWGCTARPYAAEKPEMSLEYRSPSRECGPPPYRCPTPCRDPCCSQWGCSARPYASAGSLDIDPENNMERLIRASKFDLRSSKGPR